MQTATASRQLSPLRVGAGRGLSGRCRERFGGRRERGRSSSGDPSESTEASVSESSAKMLRRSEGTLQQLCGIVLSL